MHQGDSLRGAISALRGPQILILTLALGLSFAWFGAAALALGLPCALMLLPRQATRRIGEGQRSASDGQMA